MSASFSRPLLGVVPERLSPFILGKFLNRVLSIAVKETQKEHAWWKKASSVTCLSKTRNSMGCKNLVHLQNPVIKLQWKVVVYAVRNLDHTADSYSDACEGERLMFWRKKRTMKRWLLLEKEARVVVVVICKCRCCNVDWAIISLSYLRNKWDLEFGKRSVAYRNNSKKRGLMLDIRPSFCGKLQMCRCRRPLLL